MATKTKPATAPRTPALRAEVASGACGDRISGCSAARLATTGGRDGRVRFGTGVPPADESNEERDGGEAGRRAGAGRRLSGALGGAPRAVAPDEGDRGTTGTDGAASNTRRRSAGGGGRVVAVVFRVGPRSSVAIDCGEFDGSGVRIGGDGGALGPPILRSTSRRACWGGWPESESCVDMSFPSLPPAVARSVGKRSFVPRLRFCASVM